MIAFLSLFAHVLVSPFKTRVRLEAEIVVLRHQLNGRSFKAYEMRCGV